MKRRFQESRLINKLIMGLPAAAVVLVLATIVVFLAVNEPYQLRSADAQDNQIESVTADRSAELRLGISEQQAWLDINFSRNRDEMNDPVGQGDEEVSSASLTADDIAILDELPEESLLEVTMAQDNESEPDIAPVLEDELIPTPYPEMTDAQGNPIEGMPVSHFIDDNSQLYINVEQANLRQEPNAESDAIEMLTIGMKVQRKGYGLSWSEVKTDNGVTGFVLTSLLSSEKVAVPTPYPEMTDAQGNPIEGMPVSHFIDDNSQLYINVEQANLRQEPNAESDAIEMLTIGMKVQRKGYGLSWSEIITDNGVSGFVLTSLLSSEKVAVPTPYPEMTDAQGNPIEGMPVDHFFTDNAQFYVSVERANLRQEPNAESDAIVSLTMGMKVQRKGYGLSWSKVETEYGTTGFVLTSLLSSEYVAVPTPAPTPAPTAAPTPAPAPTAAPAPSTTSSSTSSSQQKIIDLTRSFIGTTYVFGGSSPGGFDCSGMVYYTYRHLFNITLPRVASDQAKSGQSVSASNVQPGDILCFDWSRNGRVDHVGIYIGNGKYIHASASRGRVAEGTARFGSDPIVTIRRILN